LEGKENAVVPYPKGNINSGLRQTFEQYGVESMQVTLATTNYFLHNGKIGDLLPWLTEQYDRKERKATWSLTMEAAITIFVAFELVLSVVKFLRGWAD